ncbi:MAG: CCA tRNA nucleotidyltransferase [Planctomycetaceae bacterium]|nr:CCA tRNA nucleotidyltransferase [Planctomycetaceae bacterium]
MNQQFWDRQFHMSDAPREFATDIVRRLREAGFVAYFAGGCVRDLLLGRAAKDYDVATSARPEQVRELFGQRKTLAVGESFGVIVVLGPRAAGQVEVATFRTDLEYTDGRRPDRVEFCSPEEDAQRRDFTINGMFYDPVDSRVLDFVGGEHDLAAGVIRAIGDPHARMTEDKLRMLRAVRFTATLEFQLDAATADAIRKMADQLHVVSAERIAQELRKMLVDPHRRRAIELCDDVRLLTVIFPELRDRTAWERTLAMLSLLPAPAFELAFAVLLHMLPAATVHAICRRLKLSNDESNRITWLVGQQNALREAATMSLARVKRLLSHPDRDDLLQLARAALLAAEADLHPMLFCEEFLARTPAAELNPPPLITGDDLIHLGLRPGPRFKELLDTIRDAQLNREIATNDEALALARRLHGDPVDGTS